MLSASKPTSTFIRSSPWTSLASSSPMSSGPRGQCADEHLREHSGLPDGRHESSCPAKLRHAVFQWLARSHKRTRGRFRAGHRRALLSVPDARYVDGRVRVPRLAHKWNAGRQLSRDASRLERLGARRRPADQAYQGGSRDRRDVPGFRDAVESMGRRGRSLGANGRTGALLG